MARSIFFLKAIEQQQGAGGGAIPWKWPFPTNRPFVLACFVTVMLALGISLYAFLQFRQVTTLSIELVSYRYPAVESAKWLLTSLYAQLTSEKKYWVTRDLWFLMEFNDEAEEFRQTLALLENQEHSPEGRTLLKEAERLFAEYRGFFRTHVNQGTSLHPKVTVNYERKRDAAIEQIAQRLQAYVGLHEREVSSGVNDVRIRSDQVHILFLLVIIALLAALGMAGLAGFSALRRRQGLAPPFNSREGNMSVGSEASSDSPRVVHSATPLYTPPSLRQVR